MNSEKQYIELYTECRQLICDNSADILNSKRDMACEVLKAKGLPTKKVERSKYTDMQTLFKPDYGLNLKRLDIPVNPYDAFKCDIPNLSTQLYFVVNDVFNDKDVPKVELPEGVIISSLRNAAEQQPELVARYYNKLAAKDGEMAGVSALNTMLCQDGLFVYVPRGVRMSKAVQVVNILRSDVPLMVNRRVLIVVEEDAEARLLFCDHAVDDREFLATEVVEAYVGDNAALQMYSLEETHMKNVRVNATFIEQKRSSRITHDTITLHNGVTRNQIDLSLAGEGAECSLGGCAIADKQQHVDNNVQILHTVPHCDSHVLYKYVIDDKAVGAFAGLVKVEHDAQKTTSDMVNNNLCATKEARMFTQPMLEIYADDVKCSHGSTVGQLNDKALFYMQQRGISLAEARLLLQNAFVGEVIDRVSLEPLRDRLHYLVEKRFRGELNKCEGCKLCH